MASKNPFPNGVDITAMFAGLTLKKAQSLINKLKKFEARVEQGKKTSITLTVDGVKQKFTFDPRKGDAANTDVTFTVNGVTVSSTLLNAAAVVTGGSTEGTGSTGGGSTGGGTTANPGTTFTLKNDVETTNGTSRDDTFLGNTIAGNAQTFQDGDVINGGLGNDTLELIAASSASPIVFMDSVENVKVRLLTGQTLDATFWSGTTQIEVVANSLPGRALTVEGASFDTTFKLSDDNNLSVTYLSDAGAADNAKLFMNGASADATFNGAIESLTITNAGTSTIGALDASATTWTIQGTGDLTIASTDVVSAVSLAAFSGTSEITLNAASRLAFTGGTGADTLVLGAAAGGAALTSADVLNGGAGVDTLRVELSGAGLSGVSNFEVGEFTVSADVSTRVPGFTTINLADGTVGNHNVAIAGIAAGAEVNFALTSANNLEIGYVGGAANVDVVSPAGVSFNRFVVSGASTVDLSFDGNTAGAHTLSDLRFDDADSVSVSVGTSSDVTVQEGTFTKGFAATGAESLSLLASGDGASLTINKLQNGAASTVRIATVASALVDVNASLNLGSGAIALTLDAGVSGQIDFGGLAARDGGNLTIVANVAQDATVSAGAAISTPSGNVSLDLNVGASSNASFSDIGAGGGSVTAVTIDVASQGSASVGEVSAATLGSFFVSGGPDANITVAQIGGLSGVSSVDLRVGASADVTVTDITASRGSIGSVSGSIDSGGVLTLTDLQASGSIAGLTVTMANDSDLIIGSADVTGGSAASFGAIAIAAGNEVDIQFDNVSAGSIGGLSLTVGTSATVSGATFNAYSGAIGDISVTVGNNSLFTATTLQAETTIGNISLSGASGTVNVNHIGASSSVGNITIGDDTRVTIGEISAREVGSLSLAGDAAVITIDADVSVGDISITGSAATLTFAGSAAVGEVRIAGSGTISVDFGQATGVSAVSTLNNQSATAILNFTGVENAYQVTLGTGTNVVSLATGVAGSINLAAGTGTDDLRFFGSAGAGGAEINGFQFKSAGGDDTLSFATASFNLGLGSAAATNGTAGALSVVMITGTTTASIVTYGAAGSADQATDVVVFGSASFASVTGMQAALAAQTSATVSVDNFTGGQQLLVLWYNNTEQKTELSLITVSASQVTLGSAIASDSSIDLLASFDVNVSTGISGETLSDIFKAF